MKKIKYYFICLLGVAALSSSCSSDDGPTPQAHNANQVGLFADDIRPIAPPERMKESDDPQAIEAVGILEDANEFRDLDTLFEVPEGATKRNGPVTALNARIANNYTVYEWDYGYGTKLIWQYNDQGDHETFEVFVGSEEDGFVKMYEVIQNKDGKSGSLDWFGVMRWGWEILANESYHIDFDYFGGLYSYKIISNKDLSGSIKAYSNDSPISEYSWDASGSGSWKKYNVESGEVTGEGHW